MKHIYDLEERTTKFGKEIIAFCSTLKQDALSRPLISQIVRSATSIGANYMEANGASSRKDFANKIFICKKESKETGYWLKMLSSYFLDKNNEIKVLEKECMEIILIFSKIASKSRE